MFVVRDMNRKKFQHRVLVEPEGPLPFAAINELEVSADRAKGNHLD